jgi:hypothetical protein
VLAYRRPLGRWILLVPVLFGLALAIAAAYAPVSNAIGGAFAGIYPHWLLPSYNATAGFPKTVLVATLLATLAIDGVINLTVEELYFRGYLLPRLPVAGWRAIPVSAAPVLTAALLAALELAADLRAGAHPHHPRRAAALPPPRHRHAHPRQQLRHPRRPVRRADLKFWQVRGSR